MGRGLRGTLWSKEKIGSQDGIGNVREGIDEDRKILSNYLSLHLPMEEAITGDLVGFTLGSISNVTFLVSR
jgi:hypothetical protein